MRVTVGTKSLFYQSRLQNHGEYVVEVRAWADNNHDTGQFAQLTVNVVDPCMAPTLNIDDSVFKTTPSLTLEQFVFYDALQI